MKWSTLTRRRGELKRLEGKEAVDGVLQDDFWKLHERFKTLLGQALSDDEFMLGMNKRQLVRFIGWCATYRPVSPVSILTTFSLLAAKLDQLKEKS